MDTKNFTLLKSCSVSLILTFTLTAHSTETDGWGFDRDLYEQGRRDIENAGKARPVPVFTQYPTPGVEPEQPVLVQPYADGHAATYYRDHKARLSSPRNEMYAKYLEQIYAEAFNVPGTQQLTLRDIQALTFINRYQRSDRKYSQIFEVDLTSNTYFMEKDLQNMAATLYSQMDVISRKFAKVVFQSLVLKTKKSGQQYVAQDFIRFVLNDSATAHRPEFDRIIEGNRWTGNDPLSKKVIQTFMSTYPGIFKVQPENAGFLKYLSIIFNRVSEEQKNALIENFAALADSLSKQQNNLAANMVGDHIKNDMKRYGWDAYYSGQKLRPACGKIF